MSTHSNPITAPTTRISKSHVRIVATLLGMLAFVGLATACEPPGCAKDCVTSVAVNPGTTQTKVVLTDLAKVNVTIYNESSRLTPVASKSSNVFLKSHTVSHSALTPDRTYWYTVAATDEAGKVWKENGSFKAMKRTVAVTVTRIKLVDDSDTAGTGELRFGMKVNSTDFGQIYADGDMGSGTDQQGLGITKSIPNKATSTIKILVEGQDDDCDAGLCVGGSAFSYTSGSNDDADWATASTVTLNMPATNGSGSWSATTSGYALKFEVYGTWSVTYTA
jgi:hypothetical protein